MAPHVLPASCLPVHHPLPLITLAVFLVHIVVVFLVFVVVTASTAIVFLVVVVFSFSFSIVSHFPFHSSFIHFTLALLVLLPPFSSLSFFSLSLSRISRRPHSPRPHPCFPSLPISRFPVYLGIRRLSSPCNLFSTPTPAPFPSSFTPASAMQTSLSASYFHLLFPFRPSSPLQLPFLPHFSVCMLASFQPAHPALPLFQIYAHAPPATIGKHIRRTPVPPLPPTSYFFALFPFSLFFGLFFRLIDSISFLL